ncbi:hypothetical protein EJB05_26859, partial [Eragrostis curvula]
MAGGEGAPMRCTAGGVGAAGVVAEGRAMESCAAKRKAGEAASGGQLLGPVKECTTRRKAEEASGCAVMATAVAKAEDAAGEKPPAQKHRMSDKEIRWILARKPSAGPSHYRALKESNPDLTPPPEEEMDESKKNLYFMAKAFYRMEENYPKQQEWVRQELETKGYVELDEDLVRRRAEVQAAVEEEWKKIEALLLSETEGEDDDDESDDDDF